MSEHVAVMVMEDSGEEVLRMRVPAGRQFTYVCPRDGAYRLYIMRDWEAEWRKEPALDVYGRWVAGRNDVRHYAPPAERKDWGEVL